MVGEPIYTTSTTTDDISNSSVSHNPSAIDGEIYSENSPRTKLNGR